MKQKASTGSWDKTTSMHLYTVEDVRSVNAMRVHCCRTAGGSWSVDHSKPYTAKELNSAWKKAKK